MRSTRLFVLSLALVLAACAGPRKAPPPLVSVPPAARPAAPAGVKIGRPYQVFGQTYVPVDDRSYDRTGIASWYGPNFHARQTANGEIYNQEDVTAAHPTLPMPSWVEVTNLDNGRTLTVRINDRGPFVDGRIIDLSRRSAERLGMERAGLARVRVRRVFPPGDWALATPPRTAPQPVAAPAPPPTGRYIQVAALSDEGRARALASVLGDFGPSFAAPTGTGLWRVRIGPVDPARATVLLADVRAAGWHDARLMP